jgi:hypothetical protein
MNGGQAKCKLVTSGMAERTRLIVASKEGLLSKDGMMAWSGHRGTTVYTVLWTSKWSRRAAAQTDLDRRVWRQLQNHRSPVSPTEAWSLALKSVGK